MGSSKVFIKSVMKKLILLFMFMLSFSCNANYDDKPCTLEVRYSKDSEGNCYWITCSGRYKHQIDCSKVPSNPDFVESQATELKCVNSTKPISRNENGQCYAHLLCPAPSASPIECQKSIINSPSPSPSTQPTVLPTSDIESSSQTFATVEGFVQFPDKSSLLERPPLKLVSKSSEFSYSQKRRIDTNGNFSFTEVPVGIRLEVSFDTSSYSIIETIFTVERSKNQYQITLDAINNLSEPTFSDCCEEGFSNSTFNGNIYDDNHQLLNDVKIEAKAISFSSFAKDTLTKNGNYSFNSAPNSVKIEIVASKEGYSTRKRYVVLTSNKDGDPFVNRFDFGTDGSNENYGYNEDALVKIESSPIPSPTPTPS